MAVHRKTEELTPQVSPRDHMRGPGIAPSTLVEFGDYECPYCGEAHLVVEAIRRRLPDNVRLVYRNFPLPQHPHALEAAEAAESAAAQGKFWQMHDTLYRNQEALTTSDLLKYAEDIGLDVDQFERDLRSHRYMDRIERDVQSGEESGVQGTPTFFTGGRMYGGPISADSLMEALAQQPD